MLMVVSVNAEKKNKTTNNGEIDEMNGNLLLGHLLGRRCEAGWRSMDLIPAMLNPQDHRTEDNASLESVHSVFSFLL